MEIKDRKIIMNVTRKDVEERNKIILECKDTFLVYNFLDKLKMQFPEYSLETYYNIEDFMEVIHRGSLFDNKNKIVVLMSLDSDNLKLVAPIISMTTSDVVVFVEQKVLN
jgi:hypothetical protein